MKTLIACLLFIFCIPPAQGQVSPEAQFEQAKGLQREGKEEEAFLKYITIPGAEYAAVALARPKAQKFLNILREQRKEIPVLQGKLIEGDLLLALGQKDKALERYREVASKLGKTEGEDRWDYYVVEPTERVVRSNWLAKPFLYGSGSHRDNWLIRRFIALDAWDDAAKEFARVWDIHRRAAQPYMVDVPIYKDGEIISQEERLIRPAGFDTRSLYFAIDYAYFLKRRGQSAKALAILMEPLILIDMDKNPNIFPPRKGVLIQEGAVVPDDVRMGSISLHRDKSFSYGGISRKEFIRLSYGEFKKSGREDELVATLQKRIDGGENRLRRVLARVRLHQGQIEKALALELEYIEVGGFDALTSAYRRGLVYEELQKLPQAVVEYEKVLSLPYVPPELPDKDEEAVQKQMMRQVAVFQAPLDSPQGQSRFQAEVLERLHRLYSALGKTDKMLEVTLRQFDANESLLENFRSLEQAVRRFKANDKKPQFTEWAKKRLGDVKSPVAKANLCWMLEDYEGTTDALVKAVGDKKLNEYKLSQWKERFRKVGNEQLRSLLKALVKANPEDARSRLELLDLEDRFENAEVIQALELLLSGDANPVFRRGKGEYNRTQFKNYFDLAYRLMRLYEKNGQIEKLLSLGLRIARGEKPFDKFHLEQYSYRDENDLPEHANACLALAIQYANDEETQIAFAEALKEAPWVGAKAQIERRKAGGLLPAKERKPFGWANVPDGVTLIASNENVLSLTRDGKYVYAGHPWGVAIYDFRGNPVTRVAMETSARDMAVLDDALWVGSPFGLYRIDLKDYTDANVFYNEGGVYAVALRGDILWIGTSEDIRTFNPETKELRIFSQEELGVSSRLAWKRFLFDGEYVWADSNEGCRRYDTKSNTWEKPQSPNKKYPVHLIGLVDGELWGHAWLNDELRDRPCIIDRETLKATPILIDGNLPIEQRCINGPFSYFGKYRGKSVFGSEYPAYIFDEEIGKLKYIGTRWDRKEDPIESEIPIGLRGGAPWKRPDGTIVCYNDWTHHHRVFGKPLIAEEWRMLRLPDGTLVLGGMYSRFPLRRGDLNRLFGLGAREVQDGSGGLHFISPEGKSRHVSAVPHTDTILGDEVYSILSDDAGQIWLCTRFGLSVLDSEFRVKKNITRQDGLCANRVTSGVSFGGKLYFATGWRDSGGGLAVFDPKSAVFTSLTTPDGLCTDKLERVSSDGERLKLTYGVEYLRFGNFQYRQYPQNHYNPATGAFTPAGEPRIMTQNEANEAAPKPNLGEMPYLGGFIISNNELRIKRIIADEPTKAEPNSLISKFDVVDGKTFLCGSRGLAILDAGFKSKLNIERISAKVIFDPTIAQLEDAKNRPVYVRTPEDLAVALQDENPYYRAKALASIRSQNLPVDDYIPLIASQLNDRNVRVRSTASYLLTRSRNDRVIVPILRKLLEDRNHYVRAVATLALVRRGEMPDTKYLKEILESEDSRYYNFPFGSISSFGAIVGKEMLYRTLAPRATKEIFALLMEYPISEDERIFTKLGASLRKHPDAADILLTAYDSDRYSWGRARFAQAVFKHAGKEMLPLLRDALSSDERVVRSNAARACGAIGDSSSIPHLIEALDLESGLSRASIVWALGELKAKEALPHLAKLYVDARNDEKRRRGAGFRASQAAGVISAHYDTIRDLEAIGSEWDELKAVARPKPVDPRKYEELLEPRHILEAVSKIGPTASQEFYRALAGEKDAEGRCEAAIHLSECNEDDIEKNLIILRNLLADTETSVRMRAAVSLLILGQEMAQRPILEWLGTSNIWEKRKILEQLARVKEPEQLSFARKQIEAIAADNTLDSKIRQLARKLIAREK